MRQESWALEPCGTVRSDRVLLNSGLHWSFSSRDCIALSVSITHIIARNWTVKTSITAKNCQRCHKSQMLTLLWNTLIFLFMFDFFLTIYRAQVCRSLWFRQQSHPLQSQQSFACFLKTEKQNDKERTEGSLLKQCSGVQFTNLWLLWVSCLNELVKMTYKHPDPF